MGQNLQVVGETFRKTFNPTSAGYAPERITFGVVPVGVREDDGIGGITALIESTTTAATLEVWLPRVQDGTTPASTIGVTDADYFYSGHTVSSGAFTYPLAAWPGAQLRVKSGGTAGAVTVSARSVKGATGSTLV